jgi:hypothetical protein
MGQRKKYGFRGLRKIVENIHYESSGSISMRRRIEILPSARNYLGNDYLRLGAPPEQMASGCGGYSASRGMRLVAFVPFMLTTLMPGLITLPVFVAFPPFLLLMLFMQLLRDLKEIVERLRSAIGVIIGIAVIGVRIWSLIRIWIII